MARSYICGFELGGDVRNEVYSFQNFSKLSIQSSVVRTGKYALLCNTPTVSGCSVAFASRAAGGTLASLFRCIRFYIMITQQPSNNTCLCLIQTSGLSNLAAIFVNNNGSMYCGYSGIAGTTGANGVLTADGKWHLVELVDDGAHVLAYVDSNLACPAFPAITSIGQICNLGVGADGVGVSGVAYFDDFVADNATNVRIGPGGEVLLLPVSDVSAGSWVGGAGGTTPIFGGCDNVPPVGKAAGSETNTSQIKNITAAANQTAVLNCQSYLAAGIKTTIYAVMPVVSEGISGTTTLRTGSVWVSSNPTQAGNTFDWGQGGTTLVGAQPTGWFFDVGPVTQNPIVVLGTQPTITISRIDASGLECDVAFLGIYVDAASNNSSSSWLTINNANSLRGLKH